MAIRARDSRINSKLNFQEWNDADSYWRGFSNGFEFVHYGFDAGDRFGAATDFTSARQTTGPVWQLDLPSAPGLTQPFETATLFGGINAFTGQVESVAQTGFGTLSSPFFAAVQSDPAVAALPSMTVAAGTTMTVAANGWGGTQANAVTEANLARIGMDYSSANWGKLQYGLAEIFMESQLSVASAAGTDRAATLSNFVSVNSGAGIYQGGYVGIDAIASNGNGAALLAQLEALGMVRGASFGALAGGLIPVDMLDEVSNLSLLGFARPVYAETNAGSVQSQNVASMNVDYIQNSHGLTGAGLTIGFLSDSFNTATLTTQNTALTVHYAQDIASGDLAAGINVLSDGTGASVRDEGRAMMQLAYDIAPGATQLFHTAFVSAADFAQGIIDLRNAGADIIVDDVRYFAEPFFQDGIIAQAVDIVVDDGAMYFSSAGNQGTSSYQSVYRASDTTINITGSAAVAGTYRFHDFDPGAAQDFIQSFTKTGTGSATYTLNWDNPSASTGGLGATSDLAIIIFNAAGTPIAAFTSNNIGADAIEIAQNASTTWAGFGIAVREGAGFGVPTFVKTVISGSVTLNEWVTNSGTSFGHSNANGAISVAAADWADSDRFDTPYIAGEPFPYLENFSSRGDVPIFFDVAGNRLAAPQWRTNADFTAGDGGNNTFFGADASYDADTLPNFYGTSAAAPNAAALAALLKQAFPLASNAQIETALKQSAIDVQVTWGGTQIGDGHDNRGGYGMVQADRAYDLLAAMLNADTVVRAGEVALVSYETDVSAGGSPDALRFVLLSDVAAGTTIYISDRTWNGTTFAQPTAGEGTYTWVAGGALTAGTVVTVTAAQLTAAGVTLSNTGETLYFYQGGQDQPTRFLFAADIADGNTTFNGSLTGTGLVAGTNAVAVQHDNATYVGAPTGIAATNLASIANNLRWYGSDTDDIAGTTGYSEVVVTDVPGPLFDGNDFTILSGMAGGGQSDAILRIGAEDGALSAQNVARLFRDNPAFNHISDVAFDLDSGFFFFVDSDGNSINRIMRGNIADLVSGISNPTFTQLFATDGFGEIISSLELNKATDKIVWLDGNFAGDYEGGWQVNTMNYDGTGFTTVAVIDTENDTTDPASLFGVTGVPDYALHQASNTLYVVGSLSSVDGLGNAQVLQNHLMSVNLTTGAITTLLLDNADPRSINGDPDYDDGRLNPNEGQIIAIDVDQNTGIIYFVTQPTALGGNGGIFSYNPATDDLQELWNQPAPNAFNTLQPFPTGNMTFIEVDEVGGRIFITTTPSTDHENDGTPATNEHDASIHVLAIGAPAGTAPTRFVRIYEPTALGAPQGMEINYDANLAITTANATYTESTNTPGSPAGPVVTPFTNATISDPDGATLYGAQVAITRGLTAGDTLSFTNTGGITGSYNAATGVVTFTGSGTHAQYQTVLNSIRFTNAGDNPTAFGANNSRQISVNVFDGLNWSDVSIANMTVVGINDAPVNTVGGTVAATEDTGIVLTGMSVSDPDADPATQDITVTLSVQHGTIAIFQNVGNGIEISDITGNGTGTVVITATQNQINATFAAANGVTYTPSLNWNGADTLTITTNDLGQNGNDPGLTGTGTSEQDQDSRSITIAAVNDAPVVAGDGTETVTTILEDTPPASGQTVSMLFSGQYSDAADAQYNVATNPTGSSPGAFSGIAVVGNASTGVTGNWQYKSGATWVDIPTTASLTTATLIGSGTEIRFNPAANYNGPMPSLTVRLIDNSLGFGIVDGQVVNISGVNGTGGTTAYSAAPVVLSGTITPVNDAPTSTGLNGDTVTWLEGGSSVRLDNGANATIADIDSVDFDGGTLTVALSGGVPAQDGLFVEAIGTVTVAGNAVSVSGTQIATFTGGGYGGSSLVFTFDADATPAAVQALVRAIFYNNNGGISPTPGTRTVTWTLVDGDGTANGGADTLTVGSFVDVQAINDAPAGTNNTFTINEDSSQILGTSAFGFSDVNGDDFAGVVITTLPTDGQLRLNGTAITVAGTFVSAADIAANLLTFVPDANENGTPYATFTFQVRDDGGTGNGGQNTDQSANTITFEVRSVNDAPAVTAPASLSATEQVALNLKGSVTVADPDAGAGTLTATLSVDYGVLNLTAGTSGATIVSGNGTGSVLVSGTLAQINALLNTDGTSTVTYTANTDAPPASATLSVSVNDNGNTGGLVSGPNLLVNGSFETQDGVNTSQAYVQAAPNDYNGVSYRFAPTLFGWNTATPYHFELNIAGGNPNFTVAEGAAVLDLETDGAQLNDIYQDVAGLTAGAQYQISFQSARGTGGNLGANPSAIMEVVWNGVVVGTVISSSNTMSVHTFSVTAAGAGTGAGGANRLGFREIGAGSDARGTSLDNVLLRAFTAQTGSSTTTINIAEVNDAPSGADKTITSSEDDPYVFTAADFGFSDVDGNAFLSVRFMTFPGNGKLMLDPDGPGGAAPLDLSLVGSGVFVSVSDINAGRLYFQPDADEFGTNYASFTFRVVDDGGIANGGVDQDQSANTITFNITADDLPAAATPDSANTLENAPVSGNVLTNDIDPDGGPAATVGAVNGSAANVGTQITLASGALLTVNADGTYTYNPNGKFNYLVSPATAAATGAVNGTATETFTYQVAGGATTTVTITITGVDGAGSQLRGNSGNNVITGTPNPDFFNLDQGGEDTATGLGSNDIFYMGAALSAGDNIDGGLGNDVVALQGNYAGYTLGAGNLTNVETLTVLSGTDARFAAASPPYSYNLTSVDANVAAGQQLTVNAAGLQMGENLTFNGSAETNGKFQFYGGLGTDTLTGGGGNDTFLFGNLGQFQVTDRLIGGAGNDILALTGNYASQLVFDDATISGIETISLLVGPGYDYNIKLANGNVASGQTLTVNGNQLLAGNDVTIDGSAELDGKLNLFMGAGNDTLIGGAGADRIYGALGADTLTGGGGNDIFGYVTASASTATSQDHILDFTAGDKIDLSAIDANINTAANDAFSFIGNAAFSGTAGQLRAVQDGANWTVEADVDGDGIADFSLLVTTTGGHIIDVADFFP